MLVNGLFGATQQNTNYYLILVTKNNVVMGFIDSEDKILNIPPYIMGVTSNKLHAGEVLYNSVMKE
jgi:hypothetical protein